jgi:hypothetical protein
MLNLHRSEADWNEFAKDWKYPNMKAMLHDLYVTKSYSTRRVGLALGVGRDRATQLLRKYGIGIRPRGGWNR